jgi:hypothetical protein
MCSLGAISREGRASPLAICTGKYGPADFDNADVIAFMFAVAEGHETILAAMLG